MKTKKISIIMAFALLFCLSIVYADNYTAGTATFSPTESNVTYNLTRFLSCDNVTVGTLCFNITGGTDAHNYCNTSATNITIYILAPPVIGSYEPLANPTIIEPNNFTFNISTYDVDENVLAYSWKQNGSEVATSQNFTFLGNYTSAGTYNISVTVSDGNGTDSYEWILTVNDSDIINPDAELIVESLILEFGKDNNTINWTTSDNIGLANTTHIRIYHDVLGYILMDYNENGSVLLQSLNLTQTGDYNVTLEAWDISGNSNITSVVFNVNDTLPPTLDQPLQNITRRSDQPLSFDINASDPSGIDTYAVSDNTYFKISASGLLENKTSTPKGIYNLTIIINDTLGHTLTGDLTLMVVNTTNSPPTLSEVNVTSIGNGVHDLFYCEGGNYYDIDSDPEVGRYYKWYVNTSYLKNSTTYSSLLFGDVEKGDNISCEVLTTDGYESIARTSSNQLTVLNTAPRNLVSPSIDNPTPYIGETLTCINGTWGDYDTGDLINESQIQWHHNGINVGNATSYTTNDYGTYICSQRVADGEDWSSWINSSSAIASQPYTVTDISSIVVDTIGDAGVQTIGWTGLVVFIAGLSWVLLL